MMHANNDGNHRVIIALLGNSSMEINTY